MMLMYMYMYHQQPSAEHNWLLRLGASDVCSVCTFITDIIYIVCHVGCER